MNTQPELFRIIKFKYLSGQEFRKYEQIKKPRNNIRGFLCNDLHQ